MICIRGSGLIYVKENGQIEAEGIQYGRHLSVAEIEELINYFFQKMEWSVEEDINNVKYIAMCMKLAGMDTRRSIEFFLLSCSMESSKGTELVQKGAKDPGRGFIQVTEIDDKTYQKIAEEGNKWRILAGRDAINWTSNPPDQGEIKLTFSERDPGLAWESSIGFWCFEAKGDYASINDYIVKYEMHEDNQTDVGDEYQCTMEGLYFVVECFVNKGELGDAGSDMRRGYIDDYLIDGTGPTSYTYSGVKEEMEEEKKKEHEAPNGIVDRAKVYMEYYDKEEPIWNFSDDIIAEEWKDTSY